MNTQYLYKGLVPFFIIITSIGMIAAQSHVHNNRVNRNNSKIHKNKVKGSNCRKISESKILPEEQLSESFSCTAPIPCETHQLKKVIPQDEYLTDVTATKSRSIQIRILLDEVPLNAGWAIRAHDGFWLLDPLNMKRCISVDEASINLSSKLGFIYINGKRLTRDKVVIKAKQGEIAFNGCRYQGSLYVVCMPDKMLLVNCVDLEDYVAGCLNSEAWPGWPLEMNKVLAIAIRTYGVAMMREAADNNRVYHVKNSNAHQVYGGSHSKKEYLDAASQTAGIIMTYHDKPIIAMYDACCGGVITARMKGINFAAAPYLARSNQCTYCRSCKLYSWTAVFSKDELTNLLKRYIPNISKIKSIQISKKDAAGLVSEVTVKSAHGVTALSGRKIYGLPNIKSFCYSIENTPTKIIFKGRGYGHHVGLCQWGACQMVYNGLGYKRILRFYYPGIVFMKIVR